MSKKNGGVLCGYSYPIIISAAIAGAAFAVSVIIAIILSAYIPLLVCGAAFIIGLFFVLQCKKISADLCGVNVTFFLGVIKEQKYRPRECGFFIKGSGRGVYIDRRTINGNIPEGERVYIYLTENELSEDEQKGIKLQSGEPIVIIPYTKQAYDTLAKLYSFNCELRASETDTSKKD